MPNEYGKLIRDGVNYSHDTAESISYDNTTSGLTADTAQDAIDELASSHNGGHDIIDDDGTEMNKRSGLQFIGSYNTDDSTNDKSVVNVVRTMTEAQRSQLSQAEQKGFIYTTDGDNIPLTASEVIYNLGEGNTTDVQTEIDTLKDKLDTIMCCQSVKEAGNKNTVDLVINTTHRYITFSGFFFTRFAVYAILVELNANAEIMYCNLNKLVGRAASSTQEEITVTLDSSSKTATLQTNMEWNAFSIMLWTTDNTFTNTEFRNSFTLCNGRVI